MRREQGLNSTSSRQYNRGLILKLIATGDVRTRIDLAHATKLAKMTISNIVSEFIEKGIVEESETQEPNQMVGRNPILLRIAEKAPHIIGLLIFRDRIAAVLCSLSMEILDREEISFDSLTTEQLFTYSYRVIDRLLERDSNVLGIGIAIIGPVNLKSGMLLRPVRFYGIQDVPVLKSFRKHYALPVFLDHDNNCAALAEALYGIGHGVQDFIFLGISNGIGSGIVSHGKVYHNASGFESEIGHVSIDCNGPVCYCGNKGCLEMYASTYVMLENLHRVTDTNEDFTYYCRIKENHAVNRVFEDTMVKIAAALVNSVNILQPEMIILGHDCMEWDDRYVRMLEEMINERKIVQGAAGVPVRKAAFGKDAQLMGAAALVADGLFRGALPI